MGWRAMAPPLSLDPQISLYMVCQGIVNLGVMRHRLLLTGCKVGVDIMSAAVSHQDTALGS
jgi:hypothetical protein